MAVNGPTQGMQASSVRFGYTGKQVGRVLQQLGYQATRQTGSHVQFKKSGTPGLVTVAGHGKQDIPNGTLGKMARQAGMTGPEFRQQLDRIG